MPKPMQRSSWGVGERLFTLEHDSGMLMVAASAKVMSKALYYLSDLKALIQ